MDIRVELKVCEACGRIFTRTSTQQSPCCSACTSVLKDFPSVETRKRRGRPTRKHLTQNIQGNGIRIRMEVEG